MATEKSILLELAGVFGGSDDQSVWLICGRLSTLSWGGKDRVPTLWLVQLRYVAV